MNSRRTFAHVFAGLAGNLSLFLAHMLFCRKVKKVALDELGDFLYVAENQRQDSKMVHREINILERKKLNIFAAGVDGES